MSRSLSRRTHLAILAGLASALCVLLQGCGQTPKALAAQMQTTEKALLALGTADATVIGKRLSAGRQALLDVVDFMVQAGAQDPNAAYAGSVPYLMLSGNLMAGWQMARALLAAQNELTAGHDAEFMQSKIATCRFYADHILSRVPGMRDGIVEGADSVTALALEAF